MQLVDLTFFPLHELICYLTASMLQLFTYLSNSTMEFLFEAVPFGDNPLLFTFEVEVDDLLLLL